MPANSYLPADIRVIYLPYKIERIEDGRYVVLNRRHKPLGIHSPVKLDYAPYAVRLPGLDEKKAAELSWMGSPDTALVCLYECTRTPLESHATWNAYQRRLQVLAALKVT